MIMLYRYSWYSPKNRFLGGRMPPSAYRDGMQLVHIRPIVGTLVSDLNEQRSTSSDRPALDTVCMCVWRGDWKRPVVERDGVFLCRFLQNILSRVSKHRHGAPSALGHSHVSGVGLSLQSPSYPLSSSPSLSLFLPFCPLHSFPSCILLLSLPPSPPPPLPPPSSLSHRRDFYIMYCPFPIYTLVVVSLVFTIFMIGEHTFSVYLSSCHPVERVVSKLTPTAGFSVIFVIMDPVEIAVKYAFHAFGIADLALGCVFVTYTVLAFSCVSPFAVKRMMYTCRCSRARHFSPLFLHLLTTLLLLLLLLLTPSLPPSCYRL